MMVNQLIHKFDEFHSKHRPIPSPAKFQPGHLLLNIK